MVFQPVPCFFFPKLVNIFKWRKKLRTQSSPIMEIAVFSLKKPEKLTLLIVTKNVSRQVLQ